MAAHHSPVHDLALLEAVEEAVVAKRDVIRAKLEEAAAHKARVPSRIREAVRRVGLAVNHAAIARSSLDAALAIEAEARA